MYNHFVMYSERVNYDSAYLSVKPIKNCYRLSRLKQLSKHIAHATIRPNQYNHVKDVNTTPGALWLEP